MFRVLKLPRSTYYYQVDLKKDESELVQKIKKELPKEGLKVSRRRIGRIMKPKGLFLHILYPNISLMLQNATKIKRQFS